MRNLLLPDDLAALPLRVSSSGDSTVTGSSSADVQGRIDREAVADANLEGLRGPSS
jgi:hypothetical protein